VACIWHSRRPVSKVAQVSQTAAYINDRLYRRQTAFLHKCVDIDSYVRMNETSFCLLIEAT